MAKHEHLKSDTNDTQDPLWEIARELVSVAKGASAVDLRKKVSELFPKTEEDAKNFLAQLLRLRQGAEAVHQQGTEQVNRV